MISIDYVVANCSASKKISNCEYIDKIYDKMEKFDPIVLTSVEEFEPFLNELI